MTEYMSTLTREQERDLRLVIADAGLPNIIEALAAYARHNRTWPHTISNALQQIATTAREERP